ncbi:MAG: surface-adhesin E family protein [Pseudomonadota bacterium]
MTDRAENLGIRGIGTGVGVRSRVLAGVRLGVLAFALCGGAAAAQDMGWARDVRDDGWGDGRVTADGDMIIFRRPAPKGPEGYPRLQLRYEYRDAVKVGGKPYLSLLALDEYDCRGGRFRNLKTAAFPGHNAQGEPRQDPGGTEPWSTPAPNTVDAKSLAAACGR